MLHRLRFRNFCRVVIARVACAVDPAILLPLCNAESFVSEDTSEWVNTFQLARVMVVGSFPAPHSSKITVLLRLGYKIQQQNHVKYK